MEKHDISDHSPSEQEKHVEGPLEDRLDKEIPDPDARLSNVERAAIVSSRSHVVLRHLSKPIYDLANI
jgi:hypothetical protein